MKQLPLCLLWLLCINLVHAERPNILFIYMDDMGWRDTGFMGSDFYETPHLDKLAAESLVFTQAYSAAANCAPARASLLSGQYSPRHKIYNVGTAPRGEAAHRRLEHIPGVAVLDTSLKTWAHLAQENGYTTAAIGKWHLSDDPLPYGFDINIGGGHSGSPPRGYYPPHPGVAGLEDAPEDEYLTDRLTQEAMDFIKKNQERPWLIYLSHFAVHTPLHAKKELLEKYRHKPKGRLHDHEIMATMIEAVDTGVGQLLDQLDSLGLRENTVILFYSDNGGYGPATDMAPLKGYKGTYYEGGIRVPFYVHHPDKIHPGRDEHTAITGVDIYPTLCDFMDLPLPTGQTFDGVSLMPLLTGHAPLQERAIFWHFPAYLQSYRGVVGEQRDPLFRSRPTSVIRRGDWKLIHNLEDNTMELYNLQLDIAESDNRAQEEPDLALQLYKELDTWRQQIGADVPRAPNPQFDAAVEAKALEAASLSVGP